MVAAAARFVLACCGSIEWSAEHVVEVSFDTVRFVARDGVSLTGTWFTPDCGAAPLRTVIVVAGGGGIPARSYRHFASHLARHGAAVLTFDYRGIGQSRQGPLRKLNAGIEHWGVLDLGAALAFARAAFPDLPLAAVAHSIGTMLIGAAPDAGQISRLVFFGPHTGYYGDYRMRWRVPLFLTWHVLMPVLTRIVGYFPGRALGLGEDLPSRFALDWSGRRRAAFITTAKHRLRFEQILAGYARVRAKTLVLSISDDALAPPKAAQRVLSAYPNIHALQEIVTPTTLGCTRLGHLAFLRRSTTGYLWNKALAWLLPNDPNGGADPTPSLRDARHRLRQEGTLARSSTQ